MPERFDIGRAPVPPLRAEPRHDRPRGSEGHIRGVEATSRGLIRATLGSAAAAGVILVFFWLPAEYAIDLTGMGRVLGLTQMGEIKQQLEAEDAAKDAAAAAQTAALPHAAAPAPAAATADPAVIARLAAIEAQVAAIADAVGALPAAPAAPAPAAPAPAAPAPAPAAATPAADPAAAPAAPAGAAALAWRDVVSHILAPTAGIEVKLVMQEGATAEFEWTANGSVLNYDTHGDGGGNQITYAQGRGVPGQAGTLTAAFTGYHGWFWRNRTDAPVTVTLRTRGEYSAVRVP